MIFDCRSALPKGFQKRMDDLILFVDLIILQLAFAVAPITHQSCTVTAAVGLSFDLRKKMIEEFQFPGKQSLSFIEAIDSFASTFAVHFLILNFDSKD